MIRYFQGRDRNQFPREADEMFRLRARQFGDRLGWSVNVRGGWEIDEYDDMNPLYLVSLDEQSRRVKGSLRFLPSTGPTMMKGCFDRYFEIPFDIESPLIWECSRFSIEPTVIHGRVSGSALRRTTFELMHGGCEVALTAGVEQVLGIFDPFMLRVYRRTGWGPEIIASTDQLGPNTVYFGIWDVSEASLEAIRERSGLTDSVLEDSTYLAKAVA
jgi:N-acyl-L-homoserine lactone synthetase